MLPIRSGERAPQAQAWGVSQPLLRNYGFGSELFCHQNQSRHRARLSFVSYFWVFTFYHPHCPGSGPSGRSCLGMLETPPKVVKTAFTIDSSRNMTI
jgi:hypothetical protein